MGKIDFFGQKIDFLGDSGLACELGPIEIGDLLKTISAELKSSLRKKNDERHEIFNLRLSTRFYLGVITLAAIVTPPPRLA